MGAVAATSMVPVLACCFAAGPTHEVKEDLRRKNLNMPTKVTLSKQIPISIHHWPVPRETMRKHAKLQRSRIGQEVTLMLGGLSIALAARRRHFTEQEQNRFNVTCTAHLMQAHSTKPVKRVSSRRWRRLEQLLGTAGKRTDAAVDTQHGSELYEKMHGLPTEDELCAIFQELECQAGSTGGLMVSQVTEAIKRLNDEYSLDLPGGCAGAGQLALFLKKTHGDVTESIFPVQQQEFAFGVHDLAVSLRVLSEEQLDVRDLRHMFVHAYQEFSNGSNGDLSLEQFSMALFEAGVDVDSVWEEVKTCYEFFCPSARDRAILSNVSGDSAGMQLQKVVEGQLQDVLGFKQLKQVCRISEEIFKAALAPGTNQEKAQRALTAAWDEADHLLDFTETAVDAVGLVVAINYLTNVAQSAQISDILASLDWWTTFPLAAALCATLASGAQSFAEHVPQEMTINEALLYARVFSKCNLSQVEYRQLLSCPGCRWKTAEPDEVLLQDEQNTSLKLIVKGSASVIVANKRIGSLRAGSTLGEAELLHDQTLWEKVVVRAEVPLMYVEWELPQLRQLLALKANLSVKLGPFLVEGLRDNVEILRNTSILNDAEIPQWKREDCVKLHLDNLRDDQEITVYGFRDFVAQTGLARDMCLTAEQLLKLFKRIDANGDGKVTAEELRLVLPLLERFQLNWRSDAKDLIEPLLSGTFSEEDMRFILDRLGFGEGNKDLQRLETFLLAEGSMDLPKVLTKLNGVFELSDSLGDVTLSELMRVIARAFEDWDANGDGVMDLDEFHIMNKELRLNLTQRQVNVLHAYFDTDGDGLIQAHEWSEGILSPNTFAFLVRDAVQDHAQRKGFNNLQYLLASTLEIFTSRQDMGQKLKKLTTAVQDNTQEVAEFLNSSLDLVSFPAVVSYIARELSGLETFDDISGLDLAPFCIFVCLSLVTSLRRLAQGQVSDMLGHEAFVYGKVFETHDITVSEFKKMLGKWGAKWETIEQGDIVSQGREKELKIIAVGSCSLSQGGQPQMMLTSGSFLGEQLLLADDEKSSNSLSDTASADASLNEEVVLALEDTTVISWDIDALKAHFDLQAELPGHAKLEMKFRNLVTKSLARKLCHRR